MSEWVEANLALLNEAYGDLDLRVEGGVHWVRLPRYPVPPGWTVVEAEVAFRIPGAAGEAPYGFWVRSSLRLGSGATVNNYTYPVATPWGHDWGQFSFAPSEPWQPKADIRLGPNMLRFARAIWDRLDEGA